MQVLEIVDAEIKQGIPSERIILGGFSMGGAMSFYLALTSEIVFGGCFFWGAWLPLQHRFPDVFTKTPNKIETPMFLCHGERDDKVEKISFKIYFNQIFSFQSTYFIFRILFI